MGKYNEKKYNNNLRLEHKTIDNGKKFGYIDFKKVDTETLNIPVGSNSKLGKDVASISFPIWHTCRHDCECFREKSVMVVMVVIILQIIRYDMRKI